MGGFAWWLIDGTATFVAVVVGVGVLVAIYEIVIYLLMGQKNDG